LPQSLQEIINNPEKRKKLIIYINPPYAEATSSKTVSGTGENKAGVTTNFKVKEQLNSKIGNASNEIFALFMAIIYEKIPDCILGQFSKVKFVNGSNFKKFKDFFLAEYVSGFVVPAETFDNVKGKFPIGFTIWNTSVKSKIDTISTEIYDKNGNYSGIKKFYGNLPKSINKWIKIFDDGTKSGIGFMENPAPDFQNNKFLSFTNNIGTRHVNYYSFKSNNLIAGLIYFSVRNSVNANWLNDRDQFLFPNDGWQTDLKFQNDCLAFALFDGQNRISSIVGKNHWIPFTEQEVNAQNRFESNFMTDFINGKIKLENENNLFDNNEILKQVQNDKRAFSEEAAAVFDAGRELWRYYHSQTFPSSGGVAESRGGYNVNASFYDIRAYFQGRNHKGRMNSKSDDKTYMELIGELRNKLHFLADKIKPKIYEYEFLKE